VTKWNDELGVHARYQSNVPRVVVHVVDQNRPLLGHGRTDDALTDLETEVEHEIERIAFGVRDLQLLPGFVQHVNGEDGERGQTCDQPGNSPQQLVDVEYRRHLAAKVEQRGDKFLIWRGETVCQDCNNISPRWNR
jgi:hypothetical protein